MTNCVDLSWEEKPSILLCKDKQKTFLHVLSVSKHFLTDGQINTQRAAPLERSTLGNADLEIVLKLGVRRRGSEGSKLRMADNTLF